MPLAAGTLLGPYEILSMIGAGGMGEVYRARDPRLDREVAIKVATAQFSERFEREAKAVAALNHPNICTLYDVGPNYLVMEMVEGLTLKERMASGPVPLEEAIRIAVQITHALEAAHEKPIVHRDLKPANVKIRPDGTVKVLDFGLAKTSGRTTPAGDPADSPTLTLTMTEAGMILGTAGYMSPEQARGEVVDQRADIWALGVMLYEMLAGRRMFEGKTVSDTLAAVLIKEPDLDKVPARVRPVLRRCLSKDAKSRLHHAADARLLLLEESAPEPTPPLAGGSQSRFRNSMAWLAAGLATVALAALAFVHFREQSPVQELSRFQILAPEKTAFVATIPVISPDGRRLAFQAAAPDGRAQLWVRSLDTLEAHALPGTEGLINIGIFWSPDSRYIAFAQGPRLRKVEASGGPPQTVCDLPNAFRSGAWSRSGVIVFGMDRGGLWRVPAAGGPASPLTRRDGQEVGTFFDGLASFLPDDRHFVYYRQARPETRGVYIGDLEAKPEAQSSKRLLASESAALWAPSTVNGHLLFLREGSLLGQPFDPGRREFSGDAVPIAEGVGSTFGNVPWFSVSTTGVLVYRTGDSGAGGAPGSQITWFDRAGKNLGAVGERSPYNVVSLSPDGARAAVMRNTPGGADGANNADIWVLELARGVPTRFTFDPAGDGWPAWSPKGDQIAFSSARDGSENLYRKASSGAGEDELLLKSGERKFIQDWSRDGRLLMFSQLGTGTTDLWVLPLEGEKKPAPYLKTEFAESEGRFSPDGRFVAYNSNASGQAEIYVRPFPSSAGGQWQISKGGGAHPRWRRDGKELFYISADSKMMAAEVSTTPVFRVGAVKTLFPAPILGGGGVNNVTRYDVTADGSRFLINSSVAQAANGAEQSTPITVVLNWQALLRK